MNIIKIIKGWIYKVKHFDALEKECRTIKSELNENNKGQLVGFPYGYFD